MNVYLYDAGVQESWVDYNGHMRDAFYGLLFSFAVDALMDEVGLDEAYRSETSGTLYVVEDHRWYLQEVSRGDAVRVQSRVLDHDAKRIHLHQIMFCHDREVAICECMQLHVNQAGGPSAAPMPQPILDRLSIAKLSNEDTGSIAHRAATIAIPRRPQGA